VLGTGGGVVALLGKALDRFEEELARFLDPTEGKEAIDHGDVDGLVVGGKPQTLDIPRHGFLRTVRGHDEIAVAKTPVAGLGLRFHELEREFFGRLGVVEPVGRPEAVNEHEPLVAGVVRDKLKVAPRFLEHLPVELAADALQEDLQVAQVQDIGNARGSGHR